MAGEQPADRERDRTVQARGACVALLSADVYNATPAAGASVVYEIAPDAATTRVPVGRLRARSRRESAST